MINLFIKRIKVSLSSPVNAKDKKKIPNFSNSRILAYGFNYLARDSNRDLNIQLGIQISRKGSKYLERDSKI